MNDGNFTKTNEKEILLNQMKSDFNRSFALRNEMDEAEERLSERFQTASCKGGTFAKINCRIFSGDSASTVTYYPAKEMKELFYPRIFFASALAVLIQSGTETPSTQLPPANNFLDSRKGRISLARTKFPSIEGIPFCQRVIC